jgi:phosphate transport system protein
MKANHIPTTFDDKLMQLDNTIAKMGGMAEVQLADAIDALLKRDANKAAHVIEAESKIDILEAEIDELAIQMLASRQPMVEDLRVII